MSILTEKDPDYKVEILTENFEVVEEKYKEKYLEFFLMGIMKELGIEDLPFSIVKKIKNGKKLSPEDRITVRGWLKILKKNERNKEAVRIAKTIKESLNNLIKP